jgi:hypothetical protein
MANDVDVLGRALLRLEARHGVCRMDVSFALAVILIAQIQLALRHPANRGESAAQAREFVEALIGRLEASEPAVGEVLRRGFDPAHDVQIDPARLPTTQSAERPS